MRDKQVNLETVDGRSLLYWPINTTRIESGADYTGAQTTWIRNCGERPVRIRGSIRETIAKLYHAMNPKGPGDETVRKIEAALPDGYTVSICHQYGKDTRYPPRVYWHGRDCNGGEAVAHARDFDGDVLAAIESLEPKPEPERDELQGCYDEMLETLRTMLCVYPGVTLCELVARAQRVKEDKWQPRPSRS